MLDFPKNIKEVTNKAQREKVDLEYLIQQNNFKKEISKCKNSKVKKITPKSTNIYPISQKHSIYSEIIYGKSGTIGEAGCGPLAIEYALRFLGFSIKFEEIIKQCIEKGYRAYEFDDNNNIISGAGTENYIFNVVAEQLTGNLEQFMDKLAEGPITLLISNSIYHEDASREGNHYITMIGIDENENAILMDGNLIKTKDTQALIYKNFRQIMSGIQNAWYWDISKIKTYI